MNKLEMILNDETMEKRFLNKIEKTDNCWLWSGNYSNNGYGQIKTKKYGGKRLSISSSRYALFLKTKELKDGYFACHTCDNKKCVNPDHLFWGTPSDNQVDCSSKFRRKSQIVRSYSECVKVINDLSKTKNYYEIGIVAQNYGISLNTAKAVKYKTAWAWVHKKMEELCV